MYVGHTHSTRRQMYIVCVCVSSTLRVPFRYPSGSLLRSKLDPLASMGWLWVAWALLAVAPAPIEPEARYAARPTRAAVANARARAATKTATVGVAISWRIGSWRRALLCAPTTNPCLHLV